MKTRLPNKRGEFELFARLDQFPPEDLVRHGYMRMDFAQTPPDAKVCPEAACASAWWTEELRGVAKMDNGDALQSAFASIVVERVHVPLRSDQLEAFEAWLGWMIDVLSIRPPVQTQQRPSAGR